jgi:hypothetical protein
MKKIVLYLTVIFSISLFLSGCGVSQATNTPTPAATQTPQSTETSIPTNTPIPTVAPSETPASKTLPDPTNALKQIGFIAYSGDPLCSAPSCNAYIENVTKLVAEVAVDGTKFSLVANSGSEINQQIILLSKVFVSLYPDLVTDIMTSIPTTGTPGDVINVVGSNARYAWSISGIWGFNVKVDITPK